MGAFPIGVAPLAPSLPLPGKPRWRQARRHPSNPADGRVMVPPNTPGYTAPPDLYAAKETPAHANPMDHPVAET